MLHLIGKKKLGKGDEVKKIFPDKTNPDTVIPELQVFLREGRSSIIGLKHVFFVIIKVNTKCSYH